MSDDSNSPLDEPRRLLTLLNAGGDLGQWRAEELRDLLAHELDTPLPELLPPSDAGLATPYRTARGLLEEPRASPGVLDAFKRAMKHASVDPASFLPREVATVLYLAAVVAGLRVGHRLSSLDDSSLRDKVHWAHARPWLDPTLRDLFDAHLGAS